MGIHCVFVMGTDLSEGVFLALVKHSLVGLFEGLFLAASTMLPKPVDAEPERMRRCRAPGRIRLPRSSTLVFI